ncbi:DUF3343 domain-containing protein [Bacillota bacterium Meth-B3]|nr:DUF3343 domain-containing protein [Christensenellaceae bacterium]MEA5065896.1 DUF3343 domain-containing protein [Eubacteriales bacterium]
MDEVFGIAAFRSRQQVMIFEGALRRAGLRADIISTPRDVAVGCGLSVRFNIEDAAQVQQIFARTRPGNLIGLYQVDRRGGGRPRLSVLARC